MVAWDSSRNAICRVCGRERLRPRDAAGEQWQNSKGLEIQMLNRKIYSYERPFKGFFYLLQTQNSLGWMTTEGRGTSSYVRP